MNVFVYPPSPSVLWWMVWMTTIVTSFLCSFSTSNPLPPRLPLLPASIKFRDEGNRVIYDIERRFSPLSTLASNIGGLDIKSQLNNLYDKFQPLWGRKNNPNNIGSVISEITATQPGGSSSTTYTVPGTGITHVTNEGGDSTSSSATSLPSAVSASTSESSKETSSKVDDRRSRHYYYHRDYWRPPRDRPYRRRRRPYRDRDPWRPYNPHDNYGPPPSGDGYGTSPALYGIRVGESLKGHNNRIVAAASSSPSSSPSPPYPPPPYPYPYPPGVSLPAVPPGFPPPYLPASSSHLHPLFTLPLSSHDSSTTTTPKPQNVKKKKESIMPQTIINDDGTITIAGIKPQAIVNGIAGVVKKTGLNKVIGSAISSVVHQVSSASSKVVKDVAQAVQVSVIEEIPKGESNDGEQSSQSEETEEDSSPPPRPSPPRLSSTKAILSLKDTRISLKPTRNGLSIQFGKV